MSNNVILKKVQMKISIRQKLLLFSLIILTGIGFIGYSVYQSNEKLLDSEQWVRHSEQVIFLSGNILSLGKDMETASRGFVITKDSAFLKPLYTAEKTTFAFIRQLRHLTLDNPAQQQRIDSLNYYMHKRLDFSTQMVELRSKQGLAPAINYTSTQKGMLYSERISQITGAIQKEETTLLKQRKQTNELSIASFYRFSVVMFILMTVSTILLLITTGNYSKKNEKRAAELIIANKELAFQNEEKGNRSAELIIANKELAFQNEEKGKRSAELTIANKELAFQNEEKGNRAAELIIANKELAFQNEEKGNRAAELIIANKELAFQNEEKGNRAAELIIANKELAFQNEEKGNRAAELTIADKELAFQNEEKGNRAAELIIANKELAFQNEEKGNRAAELTIANKELAFQNEEKGKRAAELTIANKELVFQNEEKEKTEQERIQNERRLARAQQVAHMGSWELDFATNFILCSDEACRIYGLPSDQNRQSFETWVSFIHPEDLGFVLRKIKESRDSLRNSSFFYRIFHKNGFIRHIYSESKLEFDSHGKPTGLYGIAHDVTELKLAEEQMEFDKNNLTALINNTKDLMWSVDRDFKLITSNKPFDEIVKLSSGKTIEKGSDILASGFTSERLNRYKILCERAFAGEAFTEIEYREIPFELWSEISYYPIRKGDEVIGTACYSRDITERKHAELERIKITNDLIQRNKDLEQFAYIVSHNLRAPVANILGASIALNEYGLSSEEKGLLSEGLNESVTKLDNVVKDLNQILQVKREIDEIKEKVCFSKLVDDIKTSIKNLIDGDDIEIKYDFSEIDGFITLKSYLYSIFYNIISNSIKYRQQQIPAIIGIKSHLVKDKFELIFTDNGMGIDLKKSGDQVFGLYKRFHTNIEGKGMGLFMVKTQVETLGGKISIKSKINKGTEFRIEFEK